MDCTDTLGVGHMKQFSPRALTEKECASMRVRKYSREGSQWA